MTSQSTDSVSQKELDYPHQAKGAPNSMEMAQNYPLDGAVKIGIMAGFCALGVALIVVFVIYVIRVRNNGKYANEHSYTSYHSFGSSKGLSGDHNLALSAQRYHYQQQKQQMLDMERSQELNGQPGSNSESDDVEEGDTTVFETPGLATTGDMEVDNPLFGAHDLNSAKK